MTRDKTLQVLHTNWRRLHDQFGVRSLSLYGSVARAEEQPNSDVDLLVEFGRPTGYFGLVRLQLYLQDLLGRHVDLGTSAGLRTPIRQRVAKEAIRVG
jgi:hypothetical protein